jgi:hypothetical protein
MAQHSRVTLLVLHFPMAVMKHTFVTLVLHIPVTLAMNIPLTTYCEHTHMYLIA